MNKTVRKLYRFISAVLCCALILNSVSPSCVSTVNATEVVAGYGVLESLLALMGVNLGLGYQPDFVSKSYDDFSDIMQGWSKGDVVTIAGYGKVNTSDADSVAAYFEWANKAVNATSALEDGYDSNVASALKILDKVSYYNTGTSASNSLIELMSGFAGSYDEVSDIFDTFVNGGDLPGDNDDNNNRTPWYKVAMASLGAVLVGLAVGLADDDFETAEESEFQEYDVSSLDDYVVSSEFAPNAALVPSCSLGGSLLCTFSYNYASEICYGYLDSEYYYYFCYDISINLFCYDFNRCSSKVVNFSCYEYDRADGKTYNSTVSSIGVGYGFSGLSTVLPVFSSLDAFYNFRVYGDTSGILNLSDNTYSYFRSNVNAGVKYLTDNGMYSYLGKITSTDDIATAVAPVLAVSTASSLGTTKALEDVAGVYAGAVDDTVTDGDTFDSVSGTGEYSGILGKILAAITAIAKSIWSFFSDPITAIRDCVVSIADTVISLPGTLEGVLDIPDILDGWSLPAWLKAISASIADVVEYVSAIATFADPDYRDDEEDDSSTTPNFHLINGLLLIIYILFMLLKIFLHLLEFIINIFKIGADPGFITGDFAIGFNYIKSVELTGMGLSVYDFMMVLVHISIIFGVVKLLRERIEKIHI